MEDKVESWKNRVIKIGKMVKKNPRKRRPWRRILKRLYATHNCDMHYEEYEWRLFLKNIEVVDGC